MSSKPVLSAQCSVGREATVHQVRRSLISVDPALAGVPMMVEVAAKFLTHPKPEVKKTGVELMAEFDALRGSLDESGIVEPIKAYRDGRRWIAVDGRHRLEWREDADAVAEEQDGKKRDSRVPLIEIAKEDASKIIEGSVIGRRHWTKGQRAWLGVCQHPEVCESTQGSGMAQRSDSVGTLKNADSIGVLTATKLAAKVGVSADTVDQAVKLYRAFRAPGFAESSPEAIEAAACAESYEHLIWGGAGLGAILAGIAGGEKTLGQPKLPTGFHHLVKPLDELKRLSKAFVTWNDEERAKASRLLTLRVKEDMTPEFRLVLAEAIAAADI